jgi:hypothetical protein
MVIILYLNILFWVSWTLDSLVNATLHRLLVKHHLIYVSYILKLVSAVWGHHQAYIWLSK